VLAGDLAGPCEARAALDRHNCPVVAGVLSVSKHLI
jgi:hypothetical protein